MPATVNQGPAPVDPAALAETLGPFGASRTLPSQAYTDPAVFAWERRHFFAGSWTCQGRLDALRGNGTGGVSYRAVTAGDIGVLLTFDGERVRGFANVCRHRGHELLPEGGAASRAAVICPYHGWSYRLDGSLAAGPATRRLAGFDPAGPGLVELPVALWHGWVFVNATGDAPPFVDYLGAMAGIVEPYHPERLRLGARHEYDVAANWKVIVENYHECYHCPLIHPELCRVSPPASGDNWDLPGVWVGGAMDLRESAETMSLDGRSRGAFIEGADRRTVRYAGLFPNLLVSAHPDYVLTHRLEPLATDRTRVECCWYVPDGVVDVSYAVEFWDVTNRQDWAACESVQRGLASPHFRPGPLTPHEDAVYQWMTLVARAYQDPAAAFREVTGTTAALVAATGYGSYPGPMHLRFSGEIWFWKGPAPWYFITVPVEECRELEAAATFVSYGWGMIPVTARIGATGWKTSLFPKDGRYIVPVKAGVRRAEGLEVGDTVTVQLAIGA
jgi:Rieske 2Fe-2S family protein